MLLQLTNIALLLPFVVKQDFMGWVYLISAVVSIIYHYYQEHDIKCEMVTYPTTRILDHMIAKAVCLVNLYILYKKFKVDPWIAAIAMGWGMTAMSLYFGSISEIYLISHSLWHVCGGMANMFLQL